MKPRRRGRRGFSSGLDVGIRPAATGRIDGLPSPAERGVRLRTLLLGDPGSLPPQYSARASAIVETPLHPLQRKNTESDAGLDRLRLVPVVPEKGHEIISHFARPRRHDQVFGGFSAHRMTFCPQIRAGRANRCRQSPSRARPSPRDQRDVKATSRWRSRFQRQGRAARKAGTAHARINLFPQPAGGRPYALESGRTLS